MASKQQNELNELIKQSLILSKAVREAAAVNRILVEKYCNEVEKRLNTQKRERPKLRVEDIISFEISNELDINFWQGDN